MDTKVKKEKNLETLYRYREFLEQTRVEVSNSFDKYLLTFATGSLYLSILFTNSIGDGLIYKEFICIGWIMLIVAIISTLLSIFFSIFAHERSIEIVDHQIDAIQDGKKIHNKNKWVKFISFFEILGTIGFIIGVLSLSYFYFVNL